MNKKEVWAELDRLAHETRDMRILVGFNGDAERRRHIRRIRRTVKMNKKEVLAEIERARVESQRMYDATYPPNGAVRI